MMEVFSSESKNIGALLGRNEQARLVVPAFQRPYSWEKKHVQAFWNDIIGHQKDNPSEKYFLGPIVIMKTSADVTELLDGQQRMATATILFSIIRNAARAIGTTVGTNLARDIQRDYIAKDDDDEVYALELGEIDRAYFRNTIQQDEPKSQKALLRSHRNIRAAFTVLTESVNAEIANLDETGRRSFLKKLYTTLFRDLVMTCILVVSERAAFSIFETLNDRGLRLSVPDLLLNYLMRESPSDDERKEIRDSWTDMLEQMGRRDLNRFMRHMWVSNFGDLKKEDLFSALKTYIEAKQIKSLDFARKCADDCAKYIELVDVAEENLKKSTPFVHRLVRDLDFQPALPLLLSCYQCIDKKYFERIVPLLLVFVTRRAIISEMDSAVTESILFKLARDVRELTKKGETAQTCFTHIKTQLVENAPPDDKVRADAARVSLSSEDAKYVLNRLVAHMKSGTKELGPREVNLEHIFPQNPSDEWGDCDELKPFVDHIGNLTLLGDRLNNKSASFGFTRKKKEFYSKSELKMVKQIVKDYDTWDIAAIEKRAKKLAPLIVEVWNFNNPSRVQAG